MNRSVNPSPAIPYNRLVGEVLQARRTARGLHQNHLASALGVTQSGYSRIEKGETTLTISQLRILARALGTSSNEILASADAWAQQLRARGVNVTDEKEVPRAAILIGLGILAAIIAATS